MRVTVTANGLMREYFGEVAHEVELPESATLGGLLAQLEVEFKDGLSGSIWNWTEHRFRGPVVILVDKRVVRDRSTPLRDRQQIDFCKALVGG